jgi:hypothetical protein
MITKKDGTERLNFSAFYEALLVALLEAKGLSYVAKVQFNWVERFSTQRCFMVLTPDGLLLMSASVAHPQVASARSSGSQSL